MGRRGGIMETGRDVQRFGVVQRGGGRGRGSPTLVCGGHKSEEIP